MSANHPNRGRRTAWSNPTPADIRAAREAASLTQDKAGELIFSTANAWQKWELGARQMHPAMWHFFRLMVGQESVEGLKKVREGEKTARPAPTTRPVAVTPEENPDADDDTDINTNERCEPFSEWYATAPSRGIRLFGKPATASDVLAFAVRAGMSAVTGRGKTYAGAISGNSLVVNGESITIYWEEPEC